MAFYGVDPILVADVVLWPARSIIKQSYDARERKNDSSLPHHLVYGNLNGDGFGIGWFGTCVGCRPEAGNPCVFTSVTPAWNNENLNRLATKIESRLVFAHVRAAYPGMPVSEQNCHPFQWGRYMFMHNGVVAGFMHLRRHLLAQLSDQAYDAVQSFHSDSAVCFALFLNQLPDMKAPQPPKVLLKAVEDTIEIVQRLQREHGIQGNSLLNFCVSDGATMLATRYASNPGEDAASLYYAEGCSYERSAEGLEESGIASATAAASDPGGSATAGSKSVQGEGDYHLTYSELGSRVCLVASEPVTSSGSDWVEVPRNTALIVCREAADVLCVLRAPLGDAATPDRRAEVVRCLEAVWQGGVQVGAGSGPKPWPVVAQTEYGSGAPTPRVGQHHEAVARAAAAAAGGAGAGPTVHGVRWALDVNGTGSGQGAGSTRGLRRVSSDAASLGSLPGDEPSVSEWAVPGGGGLDDDGSSAAPGSAGLGSGGKRARLAIPGAGAGEDGEGCPPSPCAGAGGPGPGFTRPPMPPGTPGSPPSWAESHALTGHSGTVMALAATHDLLFSGATDCTIRVWSQTSLACVAVLRGHRDPIRALALCGQYLVSLGAKTLRLWELSADFSCAGVMAVADVTGNARAVAVGCPVAHPELLQFITTNMNGSTNGAMLGDGIAVTSSNGNGTAGAAGNGNGAAGAAGNGNGAAGAAGNGNEAAGAAGNGNGVHENGDATATKTPGTATSPWVFVGSQDCRVRGYYLGDDLLRRTRYRGQRPERAPTDPQPTLMPPDAGVTAPATFGFEQQLLAPCNAEDDGEQPAGLTVPLEQSTVSGLLPMDSPRCMAPRDRISTYIPSALTPDTATPADGGHAGAVTALALAEGCLFSASADATIRVWRLPDLTPDRVLRGHRGSVLALHAAGGMLLSAGRDGLVRVWDCGTLVCRRALAGHRGDVLAIASAGVAAPRISPGEDVDMLSSGFTSPQAASTGACVAGCVNPGCTGPPACTTQPASTTRVPGLYASAGADGTVRLWDARTFACLRVLGGAWPRRGPGAAAAPPLPVMALALTDNYVAIALPDGPLHLYACDDLYAAVAARALNAQGGDAPGDARLAKRAPAKPAREGEPGGALNPAVSALEREFLRALHGFIRLRTISVDPLLREDCFRGAKFLHRLLEGLGAEVKLVAPVEGRNPLVMARLGRNPKKPTITFYGHYDVQPAQEPEWQTPPFELTSVDGYLYGRGVSDNKGPVLAFVYAVKELVREHAAELPVNVAFLIEGEEENGSHGFHEAVAANAAWFEGTELVVISNTLWVGERVPCLTYGMRGMISLSLEVTGPQRDLHSGNEGGVFSEPMADLTKVLASLVDGRASIAIPGFYDGVRPAMLEPAMGQLPESGEFSIEGYREAIGVRALTPGRSVWDLLSSRWCLPSLSIVDVRVGGGGAGGSPAIPPPLLGCGGIHHAPTAGHGFGMQVVTPPPETPVAAPSHVRFGPTRFSVIPRAATGHVAVRFVPDQDPSVLIEALKTHTAHEFAKLRTGNSLAVQVHSVGDWWEAELRSPFMRLAERVVAAEWGVAPLMVREGGTMPVARKLEKMLGAPALMVPMGQSSDNCHLANERIQRLNLLRGKNVIKRLLMGVPLVSGRTGKPIPAAAGVTAGTQPT